MPNERAIGLDAGIGSPGGTGRRFPDATLPTADGGALSLDAYHPRWALVVLMLGQDPAAAPAVRLLAELAAARADVEADGGQVVAISAGTPPVVAGGPAWPFPLAFDTDGSLHRLVGAVDDTDTPAAALYVTDAYREIFAVLRPSEPGWPEGASDVLQWLTFATIQCPECSVPEW